MGNTGLKQHYETAAKTGVLQICDHKLKEMPIEVINLCDVLRNLDLSKNRLQRIPEDIQKFKLLKHLILESNNIESLPEVLSAIKKLEVLNVSNNAISRLPQSFGDLSNLKQLLLRNNSLKEFPKQLFNLRNLEVVDFSKNKITTIPNGMNCFFATELNLSQNEISSIGEDLHLAPRLKILRLEENCLSLDAVRPSLLRDSMIHTLNLDGNLFEAKQLCSLEGYNEYIERYTAMKKKMF